MKKFLTIIIAIAIVCLMFTGCGGSNTTSGSNNDNPINNEDSVYQGDGDNFGVESEYEQLTKVPEGFIGVYNADDLKNSGINNESNYILMADIDLSGVDWKQIHNNSEFNGNLHTISNFTSDKALFSSVNNISNLYLENVKIEAYNEQDKDSAAVGTIADRVKGYAVNCQASGRINATNSVVGGLFGYVQAEGYVAECENNVVVNAIAESKISYYHDPVACDSIAGGIAGKAAKVFNCINYASVTSEIEHGEGVQAAAENHEFTSIAAGGILGTGSKAADTIVDACINYGDICSTTNTGGIIGFTEIETDNFEITNCTSVGLLLGEFWNLDSIGGILGSAISGSGDVLIQNCCVLAPADNDDAEYVGAIIGGYDTNTNAQIINCAYIDTYKSLVGNAAMFDGNNIPISLSQCGDINTYPFDNKSFWHICTDDDYSVFDEDTGERILYPICHPV